QLQTAAESAAIHHPRQIGSLYFAVYYRSCDTEAGAIDFVFVTAKKILQHRFKTGVSFTRKAVKNFGVNSLAPDGKKRQIGFGSPDVARQNQFLRHHDSRLSELICQGRRQRRPSRRMNSSASLGPQLPAS